MARDGGGAVGDLGERTCRRDDARPDHARRDAAARAPCSPPGHAPVIFAANGVGGPAMEKLAATGALAGVIDYTLSELANSLMDGIHATGPERLTVAGRHGLPQLIVPGCCDFFNQGPRDTSPSASAAARATSTTRSPRSCASPRRRASSSGG